MHVTQSHEMTSQVQKIVEGSSTMTAGGMAMACLPYGQSMVDSWTTHVALEQGKQCKAWTMMYQYKQCTLQQCGLCQVPLVNPNTRVTEVYWFYVDLYAFAVTVLVATTKNRPGHLIVYKLRPKLSTSL